MKLTILFAFAVLGTSQLRSQTHYSFAVEKRGGEAVQKKSGEAVAKSGQGSPLIFIPGLDCSGGVWKDALAHFSSGHTCYILTLPGFAGQPPLTDAGNILGTVVHQLAAYIQENHIRKPVIIGHSLGGWVALALAAAHPDLPGGLVIVSSAPFLPALSMGDAISLDSTTRIGEQIKKAMTGQSAAQVEASQKMYLPMMIRDQARIDEVAAMAARSDQTTQGEVMYELFSEDLRPSMGQVRCPILALADWSAYKAYGATPVSVKANLEDQYKKLSPADGASLTIALNDSSKHFIMFDEPQWFYEQVDGWLAGLNTRRTGRK